MAWLIAIVLAPLVFMLIGVYIVLKLATLLVRLIFTPVALVRR